ncbi:hypothetical protein [Streptomyces sp. NBC_01428]|uniref:hypothetical protein n=1 Tax=Streptomyces sp. NBC_01428 TaxID=2903861 RepID=UPI002E2F935C|nr:hypothetical protein [Streptomyces sp. NBC_01428]
MGKRKYTLAQSTADLFTAMGVKAWVHEGGVKHQASPEIRVEIKENLEKVREKAGVRGSALYFGAVLLTAMDRGCFSEADIRYLDKLGSGNANYILEKLRSQ